MSSLLPPPPPDDPACRFCGRRFQPRGIERHEHFCRDFPEEPAYVILVVTGSYIEPNHVGHGGSRPPGATYAVLDHSGGLDREVAIFGSVQSYPSAIARRKAERCARKLNQEAHEEAVANADPGA